MQNPKAFGGLFGLFARSMLLLGCLYCFVGLVGYLSFGNAVGSTLVDNMDRSHVYVYRSRTGLISLNINNSNFYAKIRLERHVSQTHCSSLRCTYRLVCRDLSSSI